MVTEATIDNNCKSERRVESVVRSLRCEQGWHSVGSIPILNPGSIRKLSIQSNRVSGIYIPDRERVGGLSRPIFRFSKSNSGLGRNVTWECTFRPLECTFSCYIPTQSGNRLTKSGKSVRVGFAAFPEWSISSSWRGRPVRVQVALELNPVWLNAIPRWEQLSSRYFALLSGVH